MEQSEWVSLGEAASILGVHPTTVRHWADSGNLPSQRTPSGHRRFRRHDLEQWDSRRSRPNEMTPTEAQLMMQSALGRARLEVGEGQLKGVTWYDKMDEDTREAHRVLGRQLLEMLTHYLADPESQSPLMNEVRELGTEYADISISQGISLLDSVKAFLFFRDLLTDSVIQLAEMLSLRTPLDWGNRLRQVNHITDELLLVLLEEYQQAGLS